MKNEKNEAESFTPIEERENIFTLLKPVNKKEDFVISTAFREISPTEKRFLERYRQKKEKKNTHLD